MKRSMCQMLASSLLSRSGTTQQTVLGNGEGQELWNRTDLGSILGFATYYL